MLNALRFVGYFAATDQKAIVFEFRDLLSQHIFEYPGIVNPDIFIVTPFVKVKDGIKERLKQEHQLLAKLSDNPFKWIDSRVGTVHTVQGREADSVILVLGAPLSSHARARAWAGIQPNILNVAVSRAKENLYVIGSRKAWADVGHFKVLASALPARTEDLMSNREIC